MSDAPAIALEGIGKRFGGVVALEDVSFDVRPGEFHAVCGENGAGKSTLMKILSGVIADYEGTLRVGGEVVRFAGPAEAEAAGIAMIHQELNLVEQLSAAANIFLGREPTRRGLLDEAAMNRRAAELLGQLECPLDPAARVGTLRVGDQQLVEIAKALSVDSRVLIMDEPTSALTEREVQRLFRVIARLREGGMTILYISHKMSEVFAASDRVTVLRDGRFVATKPIDETDADDVTRLMVGRDLGALELGGSGSRGEPVLEVEGLSLPWPGHARGYRLKDVSLAVRAGEAVGVAGLMGAGRTELLECLFGAAGVRPSGRVRILGREQLPESPSEAMAAGLALVTEDRKRLGLFDEMTVRENITLCSLEDVAAAGLLSPRRERSAAAGWVDRLGIRTDGVEAAVTSLSGGNQQKCVLARCLATDPKVLLLDDPTRGVDVGAKAEIYELIRSFCRDGLGVLVTSSELPELMTLCDRIVVLCEGRLTAQLTREEFSEEAIMAAAMPR